jgi:hypothetical protein
MSNKAWEQVTSASARDISRLEHQFIECLDYSLFVSHEEFVAFSAAFTEFCHFVSTTPLSLEQKDIN